MNKKRVNKYLPDAISILKTVGIADNNGKIDNTYRANISAFGAAVVMGSFKAAVAFYTEDAKDDGKKSNKVLRSKLLQAMYCLANGIKETSEVPSAKDICSKIILLDAKDEKPTRDKWIDASVALKLAMNAYTLDKKDTDKGKEQGQDG